jgi:uncharacterized protein YrrD
MHRKGSSMEQGSYMLIERGMTVRGMDAADLGTVAEVVADEGIDVFRGIVLSHGLLFSKQSFITADHVIGVTGNIVQVNLTKGDAEQLPPAAATPAS